ncbi:SOS response-associated peptidase [Corynebacterium sp. 335C]
MCGRFTSFTVAEALAEHAGALPGVGPVEVRARAPRRWNVSPTQPAQIIVPRDDAPGSLLVGARWGLVPHWAKEIPKVPLFNARGETAAEKPSFRDAVRRSRCLVPVDGWYEWRDRVPHLVTGDGPLYMAGLWSAWGGMYTATIVTTAPVGRLAALHDRMPRVLAPGAAATWLRGGPDEVAALLRPPAEEEVVHLAIHPVGRAVGNSSAEGPELAEPAGPEGVAGADPDGGPA